MSSTGSRARPAPTSTLLGRSAMLRRGYQAITAPRSKVIIVDDDGSRAVDSTKRLQKGILTAGNKFDVLYDYGDESGEEEDAPAVNAPAPLPAFDAPALLPAVDAPAP